MGSLTPSCQGRDLSSLPGPFSFLTDWLLPDWHFFGCCFLPTKPNKVPQPICTRMDQLMAQTHFPDAVNMSASAAGQAWPLGAQPAPAFCPCACLQSQPSLWTAVLSAVRAAWERGEGDKLSKWTIKDCSSNMGWWCIDRVVARKHMLGVTVLFCGWCGCHQVLFYLNFPEMPVGNNIQLLCCHCIHTYTNFTATLNHHILN